LAPQRWTPERVLRGGGDLGRGGGQLRDDLGETNAAIDVSPT